jgi:gluconolactonase
MRYEVQSDGSLDAGTIFADVTKESGEEALDGLKVDRAGNVFFSGPGGLWIFSPAGQKLGLLKFPELPANMAWGDDDGKALYLTARTGLYRIRAETGRASRPSQSAAAQLP